MKSIWHFALAGCAVLVVLVVPSISEAAAARPYPLGTNQIYQGYIDHGTKFGVTVGDSRQHAREVLVHSGLRDDGSWTCDKYLRLDFACPENAPLDSYRIKRFLYDGQVFIFFEGDIVTAIAWDATTIYIDF